MTSETSPEVEFQWKGYDKGMKVERCRELSRDIKWTVWLCYELWTGKGRKGRG